MGTGDLLGSNSGLRPLADVPPGRRGQVRRLRGGTSFVGRMGALGFTVGAEASVVQNFGRGPLLVLIRDTRVALGRGEALKVLVEELP